MNILFLTTLLPNLKMMGSEVASQLCIDALAATGANVITLGHQRRGDNIKASNVVTVSERAVATSGAGLASLANWWLTSLVHGLPYTSGKYYSSDYIALVQQAQHQHKPTLVVVDHVQMGWLAEHLNFACPVLLLTHNAEPLIYKSHATAAAIPMRWVYEREARCLEKIQQQLLANVAQVWALSTADQEYYLALQPNLDVRRLPLPPGAQPNYQQPMPAKTFDVALLGSWSWHANQEALEWFVRHILPHLAEATQVHVAGSGADWLHGKFANVHYHGFVDDAQQFMQQAKVVAIPTLNGSGIQIKTLEAMACGSPIVATTIATRGIDNTPGSVHIADTAEEFAQRLQQVLNQPPQPNALAQSRTWTEDRQRQFQQTIGDALAELTD